MTLRKTLDWLAKQKPNNTYLRGIRANVWEYALRKLPDDKQFRGLLKEDFDWLMAALGKREGWRYNMQSTDWDNSCTQYGVLGIWAAARAGFDPGDKFWTTLSKHFRTCQGGDGGWGYVAGDPSTPNMATAGLASMFLVFDMHHGKTPFSKANPRTFTTGDSAEVLKSIERGMEWLGKAQGNKEDGYYLYGIERTGVASGRKLIGGEDWFGRGALAILQAPTARRVDPPGQLGRASREHVLLYAFPGLRRGPGGRQQAPVRQGAGLEPQPPRPGQPEQGPLGRLRTADQLADRLHHQPGRGDRGADPVPVRLEEVGLHRGGDAESCASTSSAAAPSWPSRAITAADFAASMERLLKDMYSPQSYPGHPPGGSAGRPSDLHGRSSTTGRTGRNCVGPATVRGPSSCSPTSTCPATGRPIARRATPSSWP